MKISVLTLFPEYFEPLMTTSILKRAKEKDLFEFETIDFRQFTKEKHGHVDDTPYGGGDGMLLRIEPLWKAVEYAKGKDPSARVVLMSPRGLQWSQAVAQSNADDDRGIIFICGRYEGVDERILNLVDEEWSIGKFVLTGGELAAMTMIDSIVRLIPGVLGGEKSAEIESFSDGKTLEYPQYTRPEEFQGLRVPEVLLSGHHGKIDEWRKEKSSEITIKNSN